MKNNIWQKVKIGDVCDSLDNKRIPISKEAREKGEIPYYGATGIVDYVKDYIFDEKLLLVGEDGADWSSNANTAYIINGKSWVNNHAHVLRCTKINDVFLKEYINYQDFSDLVGGSTRGKLTKGDLEKILIPFPSLETQQKIASILSSIDEAIQKTDRVIEKTLKLNNGLLDELLTKGVGHTKFKKTKVGEIPEEWNVCRFLDMAELQRGFDLPSQKRTKGMFPLISSNGVTDSNNEYKVLCPGVITGRSGTIGKVFYTEDNFWPLNTTLYIKNFNGNFPKYIYYLLISLDLKKFLSGTGVPTLNRNIIHDVNVAFPNSIEEQKKISEILDEIDTKYELATTEKAKLNNLKMGLMNDIFNQKVEIKQ